MKEHKFKFKWNKAWELHISDYFGYVAITYDEEIYTPIWFEPNRRETILGGSPTLRFAKQIAEEFILNDLLENLKIK